MTLTIDIPEAQQRLIEAEAARLGVSLETITAEALELGIAEILQDADDARQARRILSESDLSQARPLDDLRRHLGR